MYYFRLVMHVSQPVNDIKGLWQVLSKEAIVGIITLTNGIGGVFGKFSRCTMRLPFSIQGETKHILGIFSLDE
jgi:hypothetical protein